MYCVLHLGARLQNGVCPVCRDREPYADMQMIFLSENLKGDTMNDKEAVDMMLRCRNEIVSLKKVIEQLQPKADAYDNIAVILRLIPGPSRGYGEDLVWTLDKRIKELTPSE